MHATQYARDALANRAAREGVCASPLPELSPKLRAIGERDLIRFRATLDESFVATFNNALGYFQFKRFLYSIAEHEIVAFLEDIVHYRNIRRAAKRATRARAIVVTYNSAALVRASQVEKARGKAAAARSASVVPASTMSPTRPGSAASASPSGVAGRGKAKRRATFSWTSPHRRAVHVAGQGASSPSSAFGSPHAAGVTGTSTTATLTPKGMASAATASASTPKSGGMQRPPLRPKSQLTIRAPRPPTESPTGPVRRGSGIIDAGHGGFASFASGRRDSLPFKTKPVPVWNSDEVLGDVSPTFLATKLLEAYQEAGRNPEDISVEQEWLSIARWLSDSGGKADEHSERGSHRARRGRGHGTGSVASGRSNSNRSRRDGDGSGDVAMQRPGSGRGGGHKERELDAATAASRDTDVDMGADGDDGSSVTSGRSWSSSCSGASGAASRGGDLAQLASKGLFDNIVVAVMFQLQSVVFKEFTKTHFYAVYIRLRHLSYSAQRTLTHDDFDWLGRLGRGGYGSVYAARKRDTGALYAIKCMDKRLIKVRRATRLIVTERHVLASVDNPFVTGLKYAFHNAREVVLVMEMMTGGDLEFYLIRKGRFAEQLARFYCAEVVLALKYLHEHGIMHRDIKPANILLGTDGHVRLSDLGLAVFLGTPSRASTAGGRSAPRRYVRGKAGTPGFWAPEMLRKDADGRSGRYDYAADWWSFGCLLYALLAGRGPFTVAGGNTNDDNHATLHNMPRFPSHIFSRHAHDIIVKLLCKDPTKRLGSGPRGVMDVIEHPFFQDIDWHLLAERAYPPPWKPPYNAVTPSTAVSPKDVQREAKLKAVMLTAQDHAHYCDIPFSSETSVEQELIENLTLQAARAVATEQRWGRGGGHSSLTGAPGGRKKAGGHKGCVIM